MCYAIPAKILEIKGDSAKVDYGGVKKEVNISLVEKLEEGDYVLIHAGFAIEKLDKKSAEESLEIVKNDIKQFYNSDFKIKEDFENLKIKREIDEIISNSSVPTDLAHAQGTRNWVLRLKPNASEELLMAAYSHDIERGKRKVDYGKKLDTEKYDSHKDMHSKESARIIGEILEKYEYDKEFIKKVKKIVSLHEIGGTSESDILKDADSISFFTEGFEYYLKKKRSREDTIFKIRYMFDRVSDNAKNIIKSFKFDDKEMQEVFDEALNDR